MTHGALRAWRASEGASISVGFVYCACVSCELYLSGGWGGIKGFAYRRITGFTP